MGCSCFYKWGVFSGFSLRYPPMGPGVLLAVGLHKSRSAGPSALSFLPLPSDSASVQVPGSLCIFQTVRTKACCFSWISCLRKCRRPAWSLVLVINIDSRFSSFLTIRAAGKQEVDRQMGSGDVWAVRSFPDLSSVDCILSVLPFASLKNVRSWGFRIFEISNNFSSASSFLSQQPPFTRLQPFSAFQCQWLCRVAGLSLPSPVENSPLRIKAKYLNVIYILLHSSPYTSLLYL